MSYWRESRIAELPPAALPERDVAAYRRDGFVLRADALGGTDIRLLAERVRKLETEAHPGHVRESHGRSLRALHGCHLYDELFASLVRLPQLIEPARQLLERDVYVHQLKVNLKHGFSGDIWPWHQDYIYWRAEDGIPADNVTSVMLYLDDIDEFNAPIFFIPQSHHHGCIEMERPEGVEGWESNVSADLTYQVSEKLVAEMVAAGGMVSSRGEKGAAVWFDGNVVHASLPNISPRSRRLIIVTYNAVDNLPPEDAARTVRPEFLCARDRSAVQPLLRTTLLGD
jgi:hypothetical protein